MQLSLIHVRWCVAVLVGLTFAVLVPAARAADLSASEKQHFDSAKKYLDQLKSNLKLARDAAGPGDDTPPASKAKLSMARLKTARDSAANAAARLEHLPVDHADVKALQASYDEEMKAVAALEDRLSGKNAKPKDEKTETPAKEKEPAAPASAGKEEKLGYQAQNALKIATGNVEEVNAFAELLEKKVAELKAVKDRSTISNDTVTAISESIKEARRRVGFAEDQLKKLPPEHSSVRSVVDDLRSAVARVESAEKGLNPFRKQAMKQADAASYPDFKVDNQRLDELRQMVTFGNLQANRAAVAEAAKQLPAMKDETARIEKKYAPLLSQNTGESNLLRSNMQKFAYSLERFEESIAKEKETLPKQFDDDLASAAKLTDEAVRENKPLFFKGGIADRLRFADEKLVLYEALDPAGAKAAAQRLAQARADVKQKQQSLAGAIIAANELPPDRYVGPDKADVAKRATEALKKQKPNAQVLGVRIPSEKWGREAMWRYQNREWYRVDRSKLQAQVLVKRDDKVAEIHPINLWIDHMKGDAITAFPLFGDKDELQPDSLMLIEKVK